MTNGPDRSVSTNAANDPTALTRSIRLSNAQGLHARLAKAISERAGMFDSRITITGGATSANARSVVGLLSLAAEPGAELMVSATGPDAEAALSAVVETLNTEQATKGK